MKRVRRDQVDFDQTLLNMADVDAPDLSRRIMGRLGYMRVESAAARRRWVAKWSGRAGTLFILAFSAAFAWKVFVGSSEIRRPESRTIPQAVGHDVKVQNERLGRVIQTIRAFSGSPVPGLGDGLNPPADDSTDGQQPDSQGLPEDVNRSAAAPVRWV